ncbi:MAG: BLUF domain-containing protein [Ignavibacteriaceae bacterium]|nr:BLUF domain-containing protein [Ignavibacteriaceae bacterium]
MVHYTVYLSKASEGTDTAAIKSIVEKSKENNLNSGISGILFYKDGYYMQYLEGSREAVDSLMTAIKSDTRNTEVKEVLSGVSRDKLFSGSMEFIDLENISGQESALHGVKAEEISLTGLTQDTALVMDIIRHFAG